MKGWGANFLKYEGLLAVGLTAGLGGALRYFDQGKAIDAVLHGNRTAIYGALASVFGALVGFVITTLAIVLGFSQNPRLAAVRKSEHYPTLWRVFSAAIRALGAAAILPIAAMLFDRDTRPIHWLALVVFGAALLSVFRVLRCIWVLDHIVDIVTAPEPKPVVPDDDDAVA